MSRQANDLAQHDSEHNPWELVVGQPARHLRPYVRDWDYEDYLEVAPSGFSKRLQVPWTGVAVIVNFGPAYLLKAGDNPVQERRSFLAGLHDVPTLVESPGNQHCIQIDLTLLGTPLPRPADARTGEPTVASPPTAASSAIERNPRFPAYLSPFAAVSEFGADFPGGSPLKSQHNVPFS